MQTIIKMTRLYFVTYNTHTVGQDSEQDGKWPYSGTAGAIQAWEYIFLEVQMKGKCSS